MFRALLILVSVMALAPAAVQAELRDLRADRQGDVARIWLGFEVQPQILENTASADAVSLLVGGINDRHRAIEPVSRELVSSVVLAPQNEAVRIDILAAGRWSFVRADTYQNGILITVAPDGEAAIAPSVMAQAAAQPVPAREPSPMRAPAVRPDGIPEQMTALPERDEAAMPEPAPEPDPEPAPEPQVARRVVAASAPTDLLSNPADTAPTPSGPPPSGPCGVSAAAVEASPWDDRALLAHADCLTGQGEVEAASAIYEQMLAFEPENAWVAMALADIRSAAGDRTRARQLYIQAAENARTDGEAALARHLARELDGN